MWTRKTARGRCWCTFRSRSSNDMQRSSRLQSTNSTFAPAWIAASGVAMNVFDGQSTVSPRHARPLSAASAAPVQPLNATAFEPVPARPRPLRTRRVSAPSLQRSASKIRSHSSWSRVAVAMVEADREAREIGRDVRVEHRAEAYSGRRRIMPRQVSTLPAVNAQALAALELPAVVERLAAAAETEHGAASARALEPSADPVEVGRRQSLTAEAVALLQRRGRALAGRHRGRPRFRSSVQSAEACSIPASSGPARAQFASRSRPGATVEEAAALAPLLHALLDPVPTSLESVGERGRPRGRRRRLRSSRFRVAAPSAAARRAPQRSRRGSARSSRGSRGRRPSQARCRSRSSPSEAAVPSWRCVRPSGRRCPASSTTRRARDRRCSSSRTQSSSSRTVCRRPLRLHGTRPSASSRELSGRIAVRGGDLRLLVTATGAVDLALAAGVLSQRWHGAPVTASDEIRLLAAHGIRSSTRRLPCRSTSISASCERS